MNGIQPWSRSPVATTFCFGRYATTSPLVCPRPRNSSRMSRSGRCRISDLSNVRSGSFSSRLRISARYSSCCASSSWSLVLAAASAAAAIRFLSSATWPGPASIWSFTRFIPIWIRFSRVASDATIATWRGKATG